MSTTLSAGEWYKYLMLWRKSVQTVAGGSPSGGGGLVPAKDTTLSSATGTTITAASIISSAWSILNRTGTTTASFTDTTDTAVNIIAAIPAAFASAAASGSAWVFEYVNTTGNAATIAAGTGVTLGPTITGRSGIVVPRLSSLVLVVTQTSSTTVSIVAVDASKLVAYPSTLYFADTTTTGHTIPFASPSSLKYFIRSGPTAAFTDTTDTAANMVLAIPAPAALSLNGLTWTFRYINTTGFLATLAGGTGVTMDAANQIAPYGWRDFMYTITNDVAGSQAITVTSVGSGTS